MSAVIAPSPATEVVVAPPSMRGPIAMTALSVALTAVFTLLSSSEATTTFLFNLGSEFIEIPEWEVGSRVAALGFGIFAIVAALISWPLARQRRTQKWCALVVGAALVMSFLSWAVADGTLPLTGLLQGALLLAVPLIFGAMSGVLCERSGVININIEGQLLMGAFVAAVAASITQNVYVGLILAPVGGLALGFLLAAFATKYFVDQVVVGVVLNVLAVGLTGFLYTRFLSENAEVFNSPPILEPIAIPLLSQIPILGPILFQQNLIVYIMYVVVALVQFSLFSTRWGLRVRAVGEHPESADSVGLRVNRIRFRTVLIATAIAGLGGAFFTIGSVGQFSKEMSAGNGFIALAAVIFGRWTPLGSLGAALLFGFAYNLQNVLSIVGTPIPSQFMLMTPYLVTIFAVVGLVGKVRAPGADGIPFRKP